MADTTAGTEQNRTAHTAHSTQHTAHTAQHTYLLLPALARLASSLGPLTLLGADSRPRHVFARSSSPANRGPSGRRTEPAQARCSARDQHERERAGGRARADCMAGMGPVGAKRCGAVSLPCICRPSSAVCLPIICAATDAPSFGCVAVNVYVLWWRSEMGRLARQPRRLAEVMAQTAQTQTRALTNGTLRYRRCATAPRFCSGSAAVVQRPSSGPAAVQQRSPALRRRPAAGRCRYVPDRWTDTPAVARRRRLPSSRPGRRR